MAKKKTQVRRVPRAADQRMYGDGKPSQQTAATTGAPAPTGSASRSAQTATRPGTPARNADLAVEYSYVPKDLRRLGITAAALFGVMIVLGFIIK
jgi:hypothetical protein